MSTPTIGIEKLCSAAISNGASDIHLVAGSKPVLRRKGELVGIDTIVLTGEHTQSIFKGLAATAGSKLETDLHSEGMVDFAFSFTPPGATHARMFRVHAASESKGVTLTLRLLSERIPTPKELGLTDAVLRLLDRPQGLVLVTGATGSGKSTTLAALLNVCAQEKGYAISTVEQPIEYVIPARLEPPVSIVRQFDVPRHVETFGTALRGILRQDPDVIMVGELRDHETIETALRAAETGHLVFSTIHTKSAAETVDRIVDMFEADKQAQIKAMLGSCLLGILSQRLVPRADGKGVVLVFELLLQHSSLPNLIRQTKTIQIEDLTRTQKGEGMQAFDDHLVALVRDRRIKAETALREARNQSDVRQKLQRLEAEDDE